jgi:endoglucanase
MKNNSQLISKLCTTLILAATFVLVGCRTNIDQCCTPATTTASALVAPAVAAPPVRSLPTIRIKTGVSAPLTDSSGNVWLADQGFADGDTIERAGLAIQNTKDSAIYCAERYSMTQFSQGLPNGKYTVKLHFAETFEGINGPGERVFSFNVEGREFKDFDVWVKAGGALKAYVETVPVEINDGKLDITFTPNIENPEINGIEIVPAS